MSPALARWLEEEGHAAAHASDVGLHQAEDSTIIDRARDEGRTIITADLHYPRLLALSAASEPSLILFRGGEWSEQDVIDRMADILAATTAADFERCILIVERDRARRRKLPIGGSS